MKVVSTIVHYIAMKVLSSIAHCTRETPHSMGTPKLDLGSLDLGLSDLGSLHLRSLACLTLWSITQPLLYSMKSLCASLLSNCLAAAERQDYKNECVNPICFLYTIYSSGSQTLG